MKVLVGSMSHESNMLSPELAGLEDFSCCFGNEMLEHIYAKDLFEKEGIELIPTICADGDGRGGYVKKEAFDYIAGQILSAVEKYRHEIDGIFLVLHGASHIVDLYGDSGEHYLLEEIRKIVGWEMPIGVPLDPHGNVSKRFTELANVVRCYRESPHTDHVQTIRKTAELFIDVLKNKKNIHPEYARVPILIGGERCVSADEPLRSINQKLDETEKLEGIMSASYHVGFAWADSPLCCAAVLVVPESERYQKFAFEKAKELAQFAFSKREEFHFTGTAMEPQQALDSVFSAEASPAFLSDSGDNTTAGAPGYNTFVLRQLLEREDYNGKKALIATIYDPAAYKKLEKFQPGDPVEVLVGPGVDEDSRPTLLKGTIKAKGDCINGYSELSKTLGKIITVSVQGKELDVAISTTGTSFVARRQFEAAGLDLDSYQVIVVKQGYFFPELKEIGKHNVMSLTPGATDQLTENLPYKQIFRPMFPIDRQF